MGSDQSTSHPDFAAGCGSIELNLGFVNLSLGIGVQFKTDRGIITFINFQHLWVLLFREAVNYAPKRSSVGRGEAQRDANHLRHDDREFLVLVTEIQEYNSKKSSGNFQHVFALRELQEIGRGSGVTQKMFSGVVLADRNFD